MGTRHILSGILAFSLLSASCVRKTDVTPPPVESKGGKGGLTKMRVSPQYLDKGIDSCTIYMKYNSDVMPANMVFDDSMQVAPEDGRPLATFDKLKKGKYFIYGKGYDVDIAREVKGSMPFYVIDTLEKTYDIYLDMSVR